MARRALCLALMVVAVGLSAQTGPEAKPKSAVAPVILNLVPGFGVGSFILGDPLGGVIGLGAEVLGVGLVAYGFGYAIAQVGVVTILEVFSLGYADPEVDTTLPGTLMTVGAVLWVGSGVFGIIRPILFARQHNAELEAERGGVLVPQLGLVADATGAGLTLRLRY